VELTKAEISAGRTPGAAFYVMNEKFEQINKHKYKAFSNSQHLTYKNYRF